MSEADDGLVPMLAFEEFELFYKSTERVSDQRLSLNRWNYAICTAILIACAAVFNWAATNPSFLVIAVLTTIVLSAMAIIFCSVWIGSILQAKELNTAKFEVLNAMAPRIRFGNDAKDERVSFEPFQKEWKILENRKQLVKVTDTNIIALKPSNIEFLLPQAFRALFASIIGLALIVFILNWNLIVSTPPLSLPVTPNPTATLTPAAVVTPTP